MNRLTPSITAGSASMRPRDIALVLLVVTIWGSNFVVIKLGLRDMPPLLFTSLRFLFAACPLVFLRKRPSIPLGLLLAWGMTQFAIQFALLFVGIKLGMPAGLASLVIQLQAFFTIGLAWGVLRERVRVFQIVGALVALAGMAVVALHLDQPSTLYGLLMVLGAALSWATANILTKRMGRVDPIGLAAWGSLVAFPPLAALSLLIEGPGTIVSALRGMDGWSWAAVLFQSYPNTLFGFGVWSMLMRKHAAAELAPFTLLVPAVGMLCAAVVLGEALPPWKIVAGGVVLAGLAINQIAVRVQTWQRRPAPGG